MWRWSSAGPMASILVSRRRRTSGFGSPISRFRTPWSAFCSSNSSIARGRSMQGIRTTVNRFIYLASQSPRRRQLLEMLGVKHELLLPDAGEDTESLEEPLANEAPARYVQRVTQLKLDAALDRMKRRGLTAAPVLCSDTTVALGRAIYGKP